MARREENKPSRNKTRETADLTVNHKSGDDKINLNKKKNMSEDDVLVDVACIG